MPRHEGGTSAGQFGASQGGGGPLCLAGWRRPRCVSAPRTVPGQLSLCPGTGPRAGMQSCCWPPLRLSLLLGGELLGPLPRFCGDTCVVFSEACVHLNETDSVKKSVDL